MRVMNHHQKEQQEIVERYVQHRLTADERLAFQEHYFSCDNCFSEVQAAASFIAGVRDESATGVLKTSRTAATATGSDSQWFGWLKPLAIASFASAALLAIGLVWLWFGPVRGLRQEVAREHEARAETERNLAAARNQADESRRRLEIEQAERAKLAAELESRARSNSTERPRPDLIAQANVPTVFLEATRDAQGSPTQLIIPATAKRAILSLQVRPGIKVESFRVEILTESGGVVETTTRASLGRNGALKVTVPVQNLKSQSYLVRLYAVQNVETKLLGEYGLAVHKQ